jgi:hypothetical protein
MGWRNMREAQGQGGKPRPNSKWGEQALPLIPQMGSGGARLRRAGLTPQFLSRKNWFVPALTGKVTEYPVTPGTGDHDPVNSSVLSRVRFGQLVFQDRLTLVLLSEIAKVGTGRSSAKITPLFERPPVEVIP